MLRYICIFDQVFDANIDFHCYFWTSHGNSDVIKSTITMRAVKQLRRLQGPCSIQLFPWNGFKEFQSDNGTIRYLLEPKLYCALEKLPLLSSESVHQSRSWSCAKILFHICIYLVTEIFEYMNLMEWNGQSCWTINSESVWEKPKFAILNVQNSHLICHIHTQEKRLSTCLVRLVTIDFLSRLTAVSTTDFINVMSSSC